MKKSVEKILFFIIFIAGYISLSVQLIAVRQLGIFVGNTTITMAIIISLFLIFLTVGYYKGAVLSFVNKNPRNIMAKSFFIASIFILFGCSYPFVLIFVNILIDLNINFNIAQTFIYGFLFLSIPPFLFGYIVSIASRYLDYAHRNYTGKIMAIDTVGSVLGSVITTLVLMPFMGVNNTVSILIIFCMLSYMLLAKKVNYIGVAIIIAASLYINHTKLLKDLFKVVTNNAISTIVINEADEGKSKIMYINNSTSSKISADDNLRFDYLKYIDDNFIKTLPNDKIYKILILGAGGFSMGLNDTRNNFTYVDVDKELLPVSEELFLKQKLSSNKKFIVQDAYQFLKNKEKYDLIILDTYNTRNDIPFHLVTNEYFKLVKDMIEKDGIVVMNIGASGNFSNEFSLNLDNTIRSVFPNLQRQVLGVFNPWDRTNLIHNVIYVYYQNDNKHKSIYTNDKNKSFYDLYSK